MALVIKDLVKKYGDKTVVDKLSFEMNGPGVYALLSHAVGLRFARHLYHALCLGTADSEKGNAGFSTLLDDRRGAGNGAVCGILVSTIGFRQHCPVCVLCWRVDLFDL